MRLFTGLDLPPDVVANLERLLRALRPTARIQWSPPANLHITTKFIGEWPEPRLAELKAALAALPRAGRDPRAHPAGGLLPESALAARVLVRNRGARPGRAGRGHGSATAALGVAPETRAFSPHLTLARIKERVDLQPLREAIAALPELEFGSFRPRLLSVPEHTASFRFRVH